MSTLEVVQQREVVDLELLSLDELAHRAQALQAEAERQISGALAVLIDCGLVLLEARRRIDVGEWQPWCDSIGLKESWAARLIRLARYKDELPEEAFVPYRDRNGTLRDPSMSRALELMKSMPPAKTQSWPQTHSQSTRSMARRMRDDGASWKEISDLTGATVETIRAWCDPETEAKRRAKRNSRLKEQAAARSALKAQREQAERLALARAGSKHLAKAYSLVRQLAVTLEAAEVGAPSTAIRATSNEAYQAAMKVEMLIVRALRAERSTPDAHP